MRIEGQPKSAQSFVFEKKPKKYIFMFERSRKHSEIIKTKLTY